MGSVDLGPEIRVGREGDLVERTEVGRSIAVDRKRSNTVVRHDRGDTRQPVDRGIRAQERRRSVVFVGIDGDIGNVLEALDVPERCLGPPRAGNRDQDHASGNPDEERDREDAEPMRAPLGTKTQPYPRHWPRPYAMGARPPIVAKPLESRLSALSSVRRATVWRP